MPFLRINLLQLSELHRRWLASRSVLFLHGRSWAGTAMMMRTSGYVVCNQYMERMSETFPTETAAQEYIDSQSNSHRLYIVELQVPVGRM